MTDSFNISSSTKGMVLLNLSNNKKMTLKIKDHFNAPKIAPRILFNKPKAVISANFVSNFPTKITAKTTAKKVTAKATILLV